MFKKKPVDPYKDKMHPSDVKMLKVGAVIVSLVLVVGIGASCYVRFGMPIPKPAPQIVIEPTATPAPYVYEPITKFEPTVKKDTVPQDKLVTKTDENGNEIITKEMAKPTPPPAPTIDEDQLTNPNVKPSYRPEQVNPGTPQGGDVNEKGETYIPGVGWLGDGCGGTSEFAPGMGTGEQIGY